ncbi:unnamed protein product, partial [Allacma fusca]
SRVDQRFGFTVLLGINAVNQAVFQRSPMYMLNKTQFYDVIVTLGPFHTDSQRKLQELIIIQPSDVILPFWRSG